MTLEIHTLTDDDLPAAVAISAYAFNAPNHYDNVERVERARRVSRPEWYLGSFEDGEMTSMMQIIPTEMYLNGSIIPMGAVSPVASSPLHRRKGHAGEMLRRSFQWMKERGQVVSGLTTPHPALYRRYGWEIAADRRNYSFKPKDLRLQQQPGQRGRFKMLRTDDWQQLDAVYQQYALQHNGPLRRGETWWREYVLDLPWYRITDIVLWQDDAGVAQGYALYKQPDGGEGGSLSIVELIALSGDARLNLLLYFARHDLYGEIALRASVEDPLPLLFADTERLEVAQHYTVMLRVVDFESAMQQRRAAREDESCEVILHIDDRDAPWNAGDWQVGVTEGRSFARRTHGEPALRLRGEMLGPLFNGYLAPSTAAAAGLIEATSDDALTRADRIFAATRKPFFTDTF